MRLLTAQIVFVYRDINELILYANLFNALLLHIGMANNVSVIKITLKLD
jgi:hypothetical protein